MIETSLTHFPAPLCVELQHPSTAVGHQQHTDCPHVSMPRTHKVVQLHSLISSCTVLVLCRVLANPEVDIPRQSLHTQTHDRYTNVCSGIPTCSDHFPHHPGNIVSNDHVCIYLTRWIFIVCVEYDVGISIVELSIVSSWPVRHLLDSYQRVYIWWLF